MAIRSHCFEQKRTEYVVNSRPFKAWFTSRHSQLILIHDNADLERISSISFAGGLLVTALQRSEAIVFIFPLWAPHQQRRRRTTHETVASESRMPTVSITQ